MYYIEHNSRSVKLWLSKRLPLLWEAKRNYENQFLFDALHELRRCLREMECPDRFKLVSRLWCDDDSLFDVENVLFYNVGSGAFSNLLKKGHVVFERIHARPCSNFGNNTFSYLSEYEIVDMDSSIDKVHSSALKIKFRGPIKLSTPDIWLAAGSGDSSGAEPIRGRYGIYVELRGPNLPFLTVDKIKKIVDGVVSSFHCFSSPNSTAVGYLAKYLNRNYEQIFNLIRSPSCPVLGEREFFYIETMKNVRKRARTRWNPGDDRCDYCEIVFRKADDSSCEFSIFEL